MRAPEVVAQAHRVVRMRRTSPSTRHLLLIGRAVWVPDVHRNLPAAWRERGRAIGVSIASQGALRPLITHVARRRHRSSSRATQLVSLHACQFRHA